MGGPGKEGKEGPLSLRLLLCCVALFRLPFMGPSPSTSPLFRVPLPFLFFYICFLFFSNRAYAGRSQFCRAFFFLPSSSFVVYCCCCVMCKLYSVSSLLHTRDPIVPLLDHPCICAFISGQSMQKLFASRLHTVMFRGLLRAGGRAWIVRPSNASLPAGGSIGRSLFAEPRWSQDSVANFPVSLRRRSIH